MTRNSILKEMQKKNREHWIDCAKGILMAMVVLQHIPWIASSMNVNSDILVLINKIGKSTFVPFYMCAFFVITGYCSNFKKDFNSFLQSRIRSLIWPAAFLSFFHDITWFVGAMFSAQILYWIIVNHIICKAYVKQNYVVWLVMFGFSVVGVILCHYGDKWYLWHALDLVMYLHIGSCLRKTDLLKKYGLISLCLFGTLIVFCFVLDYTPPAIYSVINVRLLNLPLHWALSICGSLGFLYLCHILAPRSSILEIIGRNSLVIYLTHIIVMNYAIKLALIFGFDYNDKLFGIIFCVYILISVIICSTLIGHVMNKYKCLRWILGK